MPVNLGYLFKQLTPRDLKILRIIEKFMKKYEYIPLDVIVSRSKNVDKNVSLTLSKLNSLKLVRRYRGDYIGYRITSLGYDCLAIEDLVKRNIVYALGPKLGVGKEADLYLGLSPANEKIVVKFHRVGRTSFKQVKRFRVYAEEAEVSWLLRSSISAEREFKALIECLKAQVNVPTPLGRSRHAVVMKHINGVLLLKYRNPSDPETMLRTILDSVRRAYLIVGIVHGDLSEYNVMVELGTERPILIDWPQYVEREHPSAPILLERDVKYIIGFFKRKYRVEIPVEEALKYVRGKIEEI